MKIDPKLAIASILGGCICVGGYIAYQRYKKNRVEAALMKGRVENLIKDVPEITKPSR